MDWREEQRRANERSQKQHEENRRRQEALTRKNQEDSRRRNEEAKRLQERREDQRKRDEAERRRRSDEKERLDEEKRHNRAIETGRASNTAPQYVDTPTRRSDTTPSYSGRARTPRRRGGFLKLMFLIALIWGAVHFWPQILAEGRSVSENFAPTKSDESAADQTTVQPDQQTETSLAPKEVKHVQNIKHAVKKYPRCSATITDQCQSDH